MKSRLWQYRWEAWLIIGIPSVVHVITVAYGITVDLGITSLFVWNPFLSVYYASLIPRFILLVASYYWFGRHLYGKELLQAFWGYSMISGGTWLIAEAILLGDAAMNPDSIYRDSPFPSPFAVIVRAIAALVETVVLIWLARQLTRVSLRHGLFLVVFVSFSLGTIYDYFDYFSFSRALDPIGPIGFVGYLMLLSTFLALVVSLVKVWILGSFNQRGERWQRNVIILLPVVMFASLVLQTFLGSDVLELVVIVFIAIGLALVYAFRVRSGQDCI